MTESTDLVGEDAVSEELYYRGTPIRVLKADGTLWFAARDIAAALGFTEHELEAAATSRDIPACCRSSGAEVACPDVPGEPDAAVVLLSPVGVWLWTHYTDAPRCQRLASWCKREAARLVPEAAKNDPRTFLTLGLDGQLPPYPMRYSGRKREWIDLKESSASVWSRSLLAA